MSLTAAKSMPTLPSSVSFNTMPSGLDVDPTNNLVFVDGQTYGTLTVIDGTTGNVVAFALPLGGAESSQLAPHGVSVNTATHVAFVANQGNDTISAVSSDSSGVWSVVTVNLAANSQPHGVAANAVTNFLYVANQGTNNMSVIDTSLSPPAEISDSPFKVGKNPHGIGVDTVSNLVFVANRDDGTVSIFTGASRANGSVTSPKLLATTSVGESDASSPTGIGVNPALSNAYVSLAADCSVVVMNYSSPNTPSAPGLYTVAKVGSSPDRFCLNPNSNVIYVSDNGGNTVTAIDSTNSIAGSVTVGSSSSSAPTEMGYLSSTDCIYVAVQSDNEVAIVKATAFTSGTR
jgi:DNA-binding beta-propeller fold protein YncE